MKNIKSESLLLKDLINKEKAKMKNKTHKKKRMEGYGAVPNINIDIPMAMGMDASGNPVSPETEHKTCNNWTGNNVSTLLSWLTNANYNIECLELSIQDCSQTIRHNVILGLSLSTGAGTISVANMGITSSSSSSNLQLILNILFTVMTYIVAINTGRIKVYQIQERLEQFIKLKQEWTYFITTIAVEFQTPVNLRKDALQLILNNKEKYLDLMKRDCEFTDSAKREMEKKIQEDKDQWFYLNREFYNSHVSLLNFSKGISINDLVDSMSYFEGMNLIEAEKSQGYDPNKDIAPFYDRVDKYKTIRHFYEIDMEGQRKRDLWDIFIENLFPNYYKKLKETKREEMYQKRLERIEKEELEEEKRLNAEYMRHKMENIQRGGEEDDKSTTVSAGDVSGGGGHEDISNGTEEEEEKSDGSGGVGRSYDLESGRGGVQGDKTWFEYFNARS
jgi:hypothetical protein